MYFIRSLSWQTAIFYQQRFSSNQNDWKRYDNLLNIRSLFIHLESVKWPKAISPDMRSFLEGLLTKDSTQRLTWPDLLHHPFVRTGVKGKMIDIF